MSTNCLFLRYMYNVYAQMNDLLAGIDVLGGVSSEVELRWYGLCGGVTTFRSCRTHESSSCSLCLDLLMWETVMQNSVT